MAAAVGPGVQPSERDRTISGREQLRPRWGGRWLLRRSDGVCPDQRLKARVKALCSV